MLQGVPRGGDVVGRGATGRVEVGDRVVDGLAGVGALGEGWGHVREGGGPFEGGAEVGVSAYAGEIGCGGVDGGVQRGAEEVS